MEAEAADRSKPASSPRPRESALAWHDLRGWIAQIEQHGELARIAARVDPDEEIGAVTLLASRQDRSPALMFESLQDDATGSRILINMLGASRERYALAVGLDPSASTPEMIQATRSLMTDPIPPVTIAKERAPVNEVVLTGGDIDLTRFPVPNSGPATAARSSERATSRSRPRPKPAGSTSAAIGRCCRAGTALGFIVLPASTVSSTARLGGPAANRARWSRPTASIPCCSCWRPRVSAPTNPSSMSRAASWAARSS